jgi:Methyltransferase domain
MGFSTTFKQRINLPLAKLNLRLETLTAWKREQERVRKLVDTGYFEKPAFPLLSSFSSFDPTPIVEGYVPLRGDCERLLTPAAGPIRYDPANEYFSPADACPTYLIARTFKPRLWFEVGSGNSTKVVRQAIEDGKLATRLVCVDPHPRTDITAVADEFIRSEAQSLDPALIIDRLAANDVLFIDSSHALRTGGDVCHLLLNVVPRLPPGVLVHIHDVFLPYDYPRSWVEAGWACDEQYVVQAMLQFGGKFQVVWPGYYVQTSRPEIAARLDFLKQGSAQSLWLRML